jgi:N-acyl-D-aspartate/D-glutamate deacylase
MYSDSDIQSWEHPLDWTSYGQYARTLEASGPAINVTGLVGHGTLRLTAMGPSDGTPTADQMARMKFLLAQSMDEGAAGLSTGLIYAPGCFADTRELIELAGVAGRKGGYYASHIRNGSPNQDRPHPRLYGTFPRVIRRVVRELGAITMETAVHKMSGLTARRLRLKESGILRKGFKADAVLFDPLTFGGTATYDHPRRFPRGLLATIVNGEVVIDGENHTDARPGRFYKNGNLC